MKSFERREFRMPKRTNLLLTRWCRISWYGEKVGPAVRFHLVLDKSPALWMKVFRLDTAFHRYDQDPPRPWRGG